MRMHGMARALAVGALLLAASACDDPEPAPPADAGTGPPARESGGPTAPPERRTFHRTGDQTYRFENSFRGLAHAAGHGYDWIDVDSNYCWDDAREHPVPLATHWPRVDKEGFDPAGHYPPETTWADLTASEVRRLASADDPPYRVPTMVAMVRRAAELGLAGIEWEVKPGAAFHEPATYRRVLRVAERVGLAIEVKTVHGLGGVRASWARLRAAKRAGATTLLVNVHDEPVRIGAQQASYVDHVRGAWEPVS